MLTKFLDKSISVIEKVLVFLLGASILIIAAQIVRRYFFHSPLSWSEQTARCIFVWMTMLCVPCIFRRKGMIAFDLLVNMLPKKLQYVFALIVEFIVLFFACFYLYNAVQLCISTGARVMAGVAIPQNAIYIAPVIAMFFLILVLIEQIIDLANKLKGGEK